MTDKKITMAARQRPLGLLAASLSLGLLSACSLTPEYERPAAPVPTTFAGSVSEAAVPVLPAWSDFVADDRLRQVVTLALQNYRDLRVAMANVEQVRAQYRIQRANQAPTVNLGVTGNRQASEGGDITST